MAMLTQSPLGVPVSHVWTWSMAALAADAALDAPRASITAAPRCCTVGMNVVSIHARSPTTSAAFLPPTSAWKMSGYWVFEWLPQIVILVTSATRASALVATWAMARLWSRRVMAVNRSAGTPLAFCWAIRQLVLAGFP